MNASSFFTKEQKEEIKQAIISSELNTSGEIRVHVELHCKMNPLERALEVFRQLKMHNTSDRNGVLIYLAVSSQKLAIIGDEGINKVVPANFWDDVRSNLVDHFKVGDFTTGITSSIQMVGEKLKIHFPFLHDDVDELSNEISFDDVSSKDKNDQNN